MEDGAPIPGDLGLAKFLFTDASCRVPRAGRGRKPVAAWAAMLVCGERSVLHSGLIPKRSNDTTYCELLAVTHSLDFFASSGELLAGDRVLAFLDNQSAIQLLTSNRPSRDPDKRLTAAREHIRHLERELDLRLTFSWVPAHQGPNTSDWRGLVHHRVDRLARLRSGQEMARRNGLQEALVP